jgi:hypothetical protein
MGGKGSSADSSGMYEAMAAAQASQQAYQLGEQQLQWSQQVWNQEQPLVDQSEQAQIQLSDEQQRSLEQAQAESEQQYSQYEQIYAPLEAQFAGQAETWDSPQAQALARGQAMGSIAEQGQQALGSAAETLRSYGINPSSPRYAALYTSEQPMLGAAEAAAGTTASQNLKLQQMGLESQAINTGRGLVNSSQGLTTAGTQAGSAAESAAAGSAATAQSDLSTGSTAMTQPTQWFNAGTNAMNSYVNAVNGYNTANNQANEDAGSEFGSILGTAGGLLTKFIAKGGSVSAYADGGMVTPGSGLGGGNGYQTTPQQGGGITGIPSAPIPPQQYTSGGVSRVPPSDAGATPGGTVPIHASPSGGVVTDDVPAMLTAHEFVIPKDVAVWKGHEFFAKQIDAARRGQHQFNNREDIGGEATSAIPQRPTFVSRPAHAQGHAMGGAIPVSPLQSTTMQGAIG